MGEGRRLFHNSQIPLWLREIGSHGGICAQGNGKAKLGVKWMKLLYGTGNDAKLEMMRRALAGLQVKGKGDIEIQGLKDMGREAPSVPETGGTVLENARQKALAYYDYYKAPVFSCDSGLYFEGLPEEVQPGLHVRTVNGKYLTDDEMLEHYSGLAKAYGDLKARYHNAICLVLDRGHIYECMDESLVSKAFLITSVPYSKVIHKGFPIDSLSVDMDSGKYFYELEERELDQLAVMEGCREFFRKLIEGGKLTDIVTVQTGH